MFARSCVSLLKAKAVRNDGYSETLSSNFSELAGGHVGYLDSRVATAVQDLASLQRSDLRHCFEERLFKPYTSLEPRDEPSSRET